MFSSFQEHLKKKKFNLFKWLLHPARLDVVQAGIPNIRTRHPLLHCGLHIEGLIATDKASTLVGRTAPPGLGSAECLYDVTLADRTGSSPCD